MKYTFLIADDESVEREGLSFLLTRRGYPIRILEAVNGEQALEIVSREPVDVLITDIRMPFMDGLELARRIRERDARMKILVCTAYGEFEYAQKAISSGVTAYLLKPVQREEFYEKIDQVLAWLDEEESVRSRRCRTWRKSGMSFRTAMPWMIKRVGRSRRRGLRRTARGRC